MIFVDLCFTVCSLETSVIIGRLFVNDVASDTVNETSSMYWTM